MHSEKSNPARREPKERATGVRDEFEATELRVDALGHGGDVIGTLPDGRREIETIELRVDALGHGGDGIGTLPDGRRIFVPGAIPGDRVVVETLAPRGPKAAVATRWSLASPSPMRVAPPCPHAARCGGCQLQHLEEGAQRQAKEAAFYDALERLGGVPRERIAGAESIVASPPFRYRIRCKLQVRGGQLGYLRRGSHEVEPIDTCLLLSPALEALAQAVQFRLAERPLAHLREIELTVGADGQGAVALYPGEGAPPGWAEAAIRHFDGVDGLAGCVAQGPPAQAPRGKRRPAPAGQRARAVERGELVVARPAPLSSVRLLGRPDTFAQANAATNEALVRAATEGLALTADDEVLELYGGAGNFTFALAARAARVVVVEAEGLSLGLARRAAAAAGVTNVRFIAGDAGLVIEDLAAQGRTFDKLLLDPPRAGAKGIATAVAKLCPQRVAYVSCDPATLARDVAAFGEVGYVPIAAVPVDMFPQTFHVEGVVIMERI